MLRALGCAGLFAVTMPACASEETDDVAEDEAPLAAPRGSVQTGELVPSGAPRAGMPRGWKQPPSEGFQDMKGKCGATAVANTLLLYGHVLSPEDVYDGGVQWFVGALPTHLASYLQENRPELGCSMQFPGDSAAFLRSAIDAGRPVMLWFMMENLTSHWVTAVGYRGQGADEEVYVMSWGGYYRIKMRKLVLAWESVYGFRSPAVVCKAKSARMAAR